MSAEQIISITPIGRVDAALNGVDQFVLLRDPADDLTTVRAHDWLLPQVYRDTSTPGGYYCYTVRCFATDRSNEVIAVIEHRYDI